MISHYSTACIDRAYRGTLLVSKLAGKVKFCYYDVMTSTNMLRRHRTSYLAQAGTKAAVCARFRRSPSYQELETRIMSTEGAGDCMIAC